MDNANNYLCNELLNNLKIITIKQFSGDSVGVSNKNVTDIFATIATTTIAVLGAAIVGGNFEKIGSKLFD